MQRFRDIFRNARLYGCRVLTMLLAGGLGIKGNLGQGWVWIDSSQAQNRAQARHLSHQLLSGQIFQSYFHYAS
ncbi:MAG: hypothetical protein ABIJ49_05835 [Pseudomonadota bacterium]|uniref:hypothetical protein n=1 Tax=Stutzerimonas kunmingensis TaxID=1211807 RepID=UPI0028A6439C|nr:hypothetical protein [Stutzerimonas kunmingensis]